MLCQSKANSYRIVYNCSQAVPQKLYKILIVHCICVVYEHNENHRHVACRFLRKQLQMSFLSMHKTVFTKNVMTIAIILHSFSQLNKLLFSRGVLFKHISFTKVIYKPRRAPLTSLTTQLRVRFLLILLQVLLYNNLTN